MRQERLQEVRQRRASRAYWYLYRPKENGPGRTSEYVGKVLPQRLAEEFDIPEDQRTRRLASSFLMYRNMT